MGALRPDNDGTDKPVGAPLVGALRPDIDRTDKPAGIPMGALRPDNDGTDDHRRAGTRPAPTGVALGDVIGAFKSITTHAYITGVRSQGWQPFEKRLWQRNYYEHIVRGQTIPQPLRRYIQRNPETWNNDQLRPDINSKW